MKLKNQQIVDFVNTDFTQKKLPIRMKHAIAMNMASVSAAVKVYSEQRKELVDKFAKRDESGELFINENGNYEFEGENVKGWNEAMEELLGSDVEVPVTSFPYSVLEKCDGPDFDDLSLPEVSAIRFMISG